MKQNIEISSNSVSLEEYEKNPELYNPKLYNDDGTLNPKAVNCYC